MDTNTVSHERRGKLGGSGRASGRRLGVYVLFENEVVITMTALTVLRYLWWVHRRGNSIKTYWLAARGRASALALADLSVVGQYSGVILVRVSFSMACTIHLLSFLYWLQK